MCRLSGKPASFSLVEDLQLYDSPFKGYCDLRDKVTRNLRTKEHDMKSVCPAMEKARPSKLESKSPLPLSLK
jgi:hypothetical protein